MPLRDEDFGCRVRAARGYAGISQSELAQRITERFADYSVSAATIKRLERNDASVKGDQAHWVDLISEATGAPQWFLDLGWTGLRLMYAHHSRAIRRTMQAARTYRPGEGFDRLSFEILDINDEDLVETAVKLRTSASEVEALARALVAQGHPRKRSRTFGDAIVNAYRSLPITNLQALAIVNLAKDYFQGLLEDEIRRAEFEVLDIERAEWRRQQREDGVDLQGARLSGAVRRRSQRGLVEQLLRDPEAKGELEDVVGAAGFTLVPVAGATPRSAADAPLPPPPGELGGRLAKRREPSEEQGADEFAN